MPSTSAGIVTGLTTAALVTVGVLAYQASATVPAALGRARTSATPDVAAAKAPRDTRHPAALPAGSGTGERVVYSVDDDRVWLVAAGDKVTRTFEVTPGTVDPAPGSYRVTSRSNTVTGTDGTPIEHVVRFATADNVTIGFSAAVAAPTTPPRPRGEDGRHPGNPPGRQRDVDLRDDRPEGDRDPLGRFAVPGRWADRLGVRQARWGRDRVRRGAGRQQVAHGYRGHRARRRLVSFRGRHGRLLSTGGGRC